jgi:hypothetical protein
VDGIGCCNTITVLSVFGITKNQGKGKGKGKGMSFRSLSPSPSLSLALVISLIFGPLLISLWSGAIKRKGTREILEMERIRLPQFGGGRGALARREMGRK